MIKPSINDKGLGLVGLVVILAVLFAAFSAYSYFNPDFSLGKYSPFNFIRSQRDEIRVSDLKKLEEAIVKYYDKANQMPTKDGWCGRISSVLHPEFANAVKPYLKDGELPHDPSKGNTSSDYFFYRVDRGRYILMAAMELNRDDGTNGQYSYNFKNCHDWPGNDVYNYQIRNFR